MSVQVRRPAARNALNADHRASQRPSHGSDGVRVAAEVKPSLPLQALRNGALERTRTSTVLPASTSSWCVYQFRHERIRGAEGVTET